MQNHLIMTCLFIGTLLPHVTSNADEADERPNVLLILVDDLKPALGCYGDSTAVSPNIDRLATRGMRFDRAYCNQAVCAPSRYTLMLGSHSTSTGLYRLGGSMRSILPDAVTMPQFFAEHGYRTESLGKVFHIGHGNKGDPESFSVPHFHEKVVEYLDPDSTDGGKLTREEAYFTNQGKGNVKSLPRGAAFESPDVEDIAYADGRVAAETIRRLKAAKQRRITEGTPFFIAAGFARPHLPFSVPQKYWDLYDRDALPLPSYEELPEGAPRAAGKRGGEITNYKPVPTDPRADFGEPLQRELIHGYYAGVSFIDAQVGKLLDELDQSGLSKNTIVVLWGDHGFHLGDLGIWTKHTNYEQANRIPLLIVDPGAIQSGTSTLQPSETVDIYPTVAALAGLRPPTGPQPIDGVSLVPVLEDPSVRVRDHAYHAYPKQKLGRAVRTERYRLVEWLPHADEPNEPAEYELYDYVADPLGKRNLIDEMPNVVEDLKAMLATHPDPVPDPRRGPPKSAGRPSKRLIIDTPNIQNRPITISGRLTLPADVDKSSACGVIVAQGGNQYGYAIHVVDGRLAFDVRLAGKITRIAAELPVPSAFHFRAKLTKDKMLLSIDDDQVASGPSPGLISVQPRDGLDVGDDNLTPAGDYSSPNPFNGKVDEFSVDTGEPTVSHNQSFPKSLSVK